MAQRHDYIPRDDDSLLDFAKRLYAYALQNHQRWMAPSPAGFLDAPIAAYETALAAHKNPDSGKVSTMVKNEKKDALVKALRTYIQGFLARNPNVTNEDRALCSLPVRDTEPTEIPVPDIKPETTAVPEGEGRHVVTAVNPQTGNKRKPEQVASVAFAHRLREAGEPRARAEDMPSEAQTGTTRAFQWTESDYGKICDYATAYENESLERGPWSNVVSLLVG